jgi:hypothetical protein
MHRPLGSGTAGCIRVDQILPALLASMRRYGIFKIVGLFWRVCDCHLPYIRRLRPASSGWPCELSLAPRLGPAKITPIRSRFRRNNVWPRFHHISVTLPARLLASFPPRADGGNLPGRTQAMEAVGTAQSRDVCRRLAHTAHDSDVASGALDSNFPARLCISFGLTADTGRHPQRRGTSSNASPKRSQPMAAAANRRPWRKTQV